MSVLVPADAHAQEIVDSSFEYADGNRVVRMEVVVPGTIEEIWDLWTTQDGLQSWMAPLVHIELKVGGKWEASYDPTKRIGDDGNIQNEILSYSPYEMLSMRVVKAPPDYPLDLEKVKKTHTVVFFRVADEDHVRVIVCGVGFEKGEDWDEIYDVAVQSTRYSLIEFYKRCERDA